MGNVGVKHSFQPITDEQSRNVTVTNYNQTVTFHEYSSHKLVFLQDSCPDSMKPHNISMKIKLEFDPSESQPVIGISSFKNMTSWNDCIWWNVRDGTIHGIGLHKTLPVCKNGAIVECCLNVASSVLTVKVTNSDMDTISDSINIPNLPKVVNPFVGIVFTGKSQVSCNLIDSNGVLKEYPLTNVIESVSFTTTYGNMTVALDGRRISRTGTQQGNSCALLNKKITCGKHRWKLEILCDFGASFCAGVARYPFRLSEEYLKDPMKHVYRHPGLLVYRSYHGLLYRDGKQLDRILSALGWQHNTRVTLEFEVNMEAGTIEIFRNDESLGIAFTDITGPIQPVVCFYASYEKDIKLLNFLSKVEESSSPSTAVKASSPIVAKDVCFDATNKFGEVSLSSDSKTLYRKKNESGNSMCFLNLNCSSGTYRFSFVIENDQGASTCIGVTQETYCKALKISDIGNIYTSESFYFYRSFQGMLYSKGIEQTKRLDEFWMSGSLVEMTIKVVENEASVCFAVNGKDQDAPIFSGLRPPITPLVAFYAGMEKRVTVIHFEHIPKYPSNKVTPSQLNQLNTSKTNAVEVRLPIVAKSTDATHSPWCLECNDKTDVICLPCKHTPFCAKHACLDGHSFRQCLICSRDVSQLWNILDSCS